MASNFPPGYTEASEPGRWFEELSEAPPNKQCFWCEDDAELTDEDGQHWCGPCAGEHDHNMRLSAEEDAALESFRD